MRRTSNWQIASAFLLSCVIYLIFVVRTERRHSAEYSKDAELLRAVREIRSTDIRMSRSILSSEENLIFVGGVPRSGTTLMRAMLDAHPDIRCGEETMIIPTLLQMRQGWRVSFFNESTTVRRAMDDATSAFLLEMIAKNGDMARRLCNKDPLTAVHSQYLYELFPNSKYLLMIRDGRAVVHSMIEREVPVGGFNRQNPVQMLSEWSRLVRKMYKECIELPPGVCLIVYYERLVQRPEPEMRRILSFLEENWSEAVLRHEEQIGGEVKLNPHEFSTSQVAEAVYEKALTAWFGSFQLNTVLDMDKLAPMLKFLGYNTSVGNPSYDVFASEDFYRKQPFAMITA